MPFLKDYLEQLWMLTNQMAPWLLMGLLFAGILNQYIPKQNIRRKLGESRWKSLIRATLIGVPLPLCSCGVIPVGVSLYKNGASKGACNSFLISTPQTGIDSILATYSLMGFPFALLRPLIAFLTGIFGGWLTHNAERRYNNKHPLSPNRPACSDNECSITDKATASSEDKKDTSKHNRYNPKNKIASVLHYGFVEMMDDIAGRLIIGLLLAALLSVLIPADFFTDKLGNTRLEIPLMLALSIPLYVCATGSIPIAAIFLMKGLSPGAALVFLMAGPATNIATISIIRSALGKIALRTYLVAIIGGAVFFGILVNLCIPREIFISRPEPAVSSHHSGSFHILSLAGTILLLICLALYLIRKISRKKNKHPMKQKNTYRIKVAGMNCNHCKRNVEEHLQTIEKLENLSVNLESGLVSFSGHPDIEQVKATIKSIGYQVIEP
ncbi:MAG: heavy metal-associated domain-containing protein [Bacteroidia bacterium]|nr:MAG: heavy metal-associated domain-containing protein [Bacteroidia bacterium]